MYDVLLIKPDFADIAIMPPLGLGYLASMLSRVGISVKIHDNTLFNYKDNEIVNLLTEVYPQIVGISATTPMIRRALEIATLVKAVNRQILIVLGGPHPSCAVEELLAFEAVDVIVIGEGEETFTEIALNFKKGNRDFSEIKGCAFKNTHNEFVITQPRDMIDNLDTLPFPNLNEGSLELYFSKGGNFGSLQRHSRSLPIIASRGCPSNCTFCQRFLGKRFRVRSAENIVDELVYRKEKFNVTEFNFLDDNFTLNKKRVIETCDLLHRKNLKISFRFPNGVREDFLDEEILFALKSAGCYHLDFGIESGSQRVLDIMKKDKKIEQIREKVNFCKKNGFKVSASFLFGTPGETIEDMEATIKFATSLPLDSASFGLVIPFPGTELRKEAIQKGYLIKRDYKYYNPTLPEFKPLIETPDWSATDLLFMLKKANRNFFLRPKQLMKIVWFVNNPNNRKRYIQALRRLFQLLVQNNQLNKKHDNN